MLVKRLAACLFLMTTVFSGAAFAEDFQISGTFDGYSMFSLNRPTNQSVPVRAFDYKHAQFSLNYAEVVVEKKADPLGFRADIGFGDAARVVSQAKCPQEDIQRNDVHGVFSHSHGISRPACEGNGSAVLQHLQQAYITGKVNDKVQMEFGKFVTPLGAEVAETKDNWNYSRGLLFTYAIPFYHFGLRANVAQFKSLSYSLYLVNGWNNVQDNNSAKTGILSTSWRPIERLNIMANLVVGNENPNLDKTISLGVTPLGNGQLSIPPFGRSLPIRGLLDTTLTLKISDGVSLMTNYDYGTQKDDITGNNLDWTGIAAYARIKLGDKFMVSPRYEVFKDPDGFMTGTPQKLQETTLTFQHTLGENSSVYVEWRRDWNRNGVDPPLSPGQDFFDPVLNIMIHNVHSHNFQHTFLVGWVYAFTHSN